MGAQVDDDEFWVDANPRRQQVLYNWLAKSNMHPIMPNADEIIARPPMLQQLCEQLQLDPTGVCYSWDPDKHSAAQAPELNLDDMTAKWRDLYELGTAVALRSFVDAEMPGYEYLCRGELQI